MEQTHPPTHDIKPPSGNIIECVTDVESEMYELICKVPDSISDNEIFEALESSLGNKRGD